ncbi:MAG: helix-turn-helix transcriptional regulator [Clostridia bacterium]|nr:helix-turn-helix transcriptional regulator [Clostridia bacterium]
MDEKEIIATNIAYYRKKCGLSQLELAQKLQYSNKNISKWEKGETVPSIFTLKRLAEIFGVTVDTLISEVDETAESEIATTSEATSTVKKRFSLGKLWWLLLANAILIAGVCVAIYVLSLIGVTTFNKWLLLVYVPPVSALSIFIFVACIEKRFEVISISVAGWLTALSVYVTMPYVSGIEFIFFLMFGFQVLMLFLMLVVNHHIKNRKKKIEKDDKEDNKKE